MKAKHTLDKLYACLRVLVSAMAMPKSGTTNAPTATHTHTSSIFYFNFGIAIFSKVFLPEN